MKKTSAERFASYQVFHSDLDVLLKAVERLVKELGLEAMDTSASVIPVPSGFDRPFQVSDCYYYAEVRCHGPLPLPSQEVVNHD